MGALPFALEQAVERDRTKPYGAQPKEMAKHDFSQIA
jgi:hypothetical protein